MPPNVRLHKVAAHADPLAVPGRELRAVLGNTAADAAARAAEQADLSKVRRDAAAVAAWRAVQEAKLFQYFQYLVDLARLVTARRRQQHQLEGSEPLPEPDLQHAETLWAAQNPPPLPPAVWPELEESALLHLQWPPWYTVPLWKWASSLGWPDASQPSQPSVGITYLELLADFSASTGVFPPKCRKARHRIQWYSLCEGPGLMAPVAVGEAITTFVSSLRALGKVLHCNFLPGPVHRAVRSLRPLGPEPGGRKGVLARPHLQCAAQVGQALGKYLRTRSGEELRQLALGTCPRACHEALARRWEAAETSRLRRRTRGGV